MSRPYLWALVACSASKLSSPAPARELYTGALFKASYEFATLVAERVLILSAKHGVVEPEKVLAPYDLALAHLEKHQREQWGANVSIQLRAHFGPELTSHRTMASASAVLCLAPGSYFDAIGFIYGAARWERPLKGMGIGEQKQRLAQLAQTREAA